MAAQPQLPFVSVEAYLEQDRQSQGVRYEYDDGYVRMMAGGAANHSLICGNLITLLNLALRASTCLVHTADMRVQVSASKYYYPDASISCHADDQGQTDILRHPRLVAEVLSPNTAYLDRGRKAMAYRACASVEVYLIIDPTRPFIEIYQRLGAGWDITTLEALDEMVNLPSLGITFLLADLYRKVVFAV